MPRGAADLEPVAGAQARVQVAAGGAVGLALDGDPVGAGRRAGRRASSCAAAAAPRGRAGCGPSGTGPGSAGGSGAPAGSSRRMEITESLSRSTPTTASGRKPGQAGGGLAVVSPALPPPGAASSSARNEACQPGAERRDPERAEQVLALVAGEVEQRVDLGDGHPLRARGELRDLVARLHLALLEHAEVEAGPAVGDEQGRDARVVHAEPDAVARDPRLGDLEDGAADPVAVADADLVVVQPLDGEVLAELPVDEVVAARARAPSSGRSRAGRRTRRAARRRARRGRPDRRRRC